MSCSVLVFSDFKEKLVSLLGESHRFDSVLFCFEGFRRYKFLKSELCLQHASDLLVRNADLGCFLSPLWTYYLYPASARCSHLGLPGLCGRVISALGRSVDKDECHIFISPDRHHCVLLYWLGDELVSLHRHFPRHVFSLNGFKKHQKVIKLTWKQTWNILFDVKKTTAKKHVNLR